MEKNMEKNKIKHVYWKNDEFRVWYGMVWIFLDFHTLYFNFTQLNLAKLGQSGSLNKLEEGLKSTRTLIITPLVKLITKRSKLLRLTSR